VLQLLQRPVDHSVFPWNVKCKCTDKRLAHMNVMARKNIGTCRIDVGYLFGSGPARKRVAARGDVLAVLCCYTPVRRISVAATLPLRRGSPLETKRPGGACPNGQPTTSYKPPLTPGIDGICSELPYEVEWNDGLNAPSGFPYRLICSSLPDWVATVRRAISPLWFPISIDFALAYPIG
jgi:hypothetical protein